MRYGAGVDVGSTQTKAAIVDLDGRIVGRALIETGANVVTAAEQAFQIALSNAGIQEAEVGSVAGTGYGRYRVTFGHFQVTEISCHARGAVHVFPNTRSVVDMGGQDTKAIRVSPSGDIVDFCMNDKCAAGTGRFLGAAAAALEIPLGELGPTALKAERAVPITTTCTVFAESEVLSWVARGRKIDEILLGVHQSIVARTRGLMRRVGIESEVTFTGGVSCNIGMVKVLTERLGMPLNVSDDSHYMGAIGAALFARDRLVGKTAGAAADAAEVRA
jgi:(R)-2-hydroxyacyl-CoA dehydratese activating ATPase